MKKTNVAKQLAKMCERLSAVPAGDQVKPNSAGATILALHWGVEVWSADFLKILRLCVERFDKAEVLVLAMTSDDEDARKSSLQLISKAKSTFQHPGINASWQGQQSSVSNRLKDVVTPLHQVSMAFNHYEPEFEYTLEERDELLGLVSELIVWMKGAQLADGDFIRELLISGLVDFEFSLQKLEWVGTPYALATLREVIGSYWALEREYTKLAEHPNAEAILKKTEKVVKVAYEKIATAKGVVETGNWALAIYNSTLLLAAPQVQKLIGNA